MGNFSTDSFPNNRWVLGDTLSDLVSCVQSIDAAIRHAFGFSVNTLVAPFDIADDGSIVVQTSVAIGTSNAMIDIVDTIPGSPGANEDQKLAHVEAIRSFYTLAEIPGTNVNLSTGNFDNNLSSADDTAQKAFDTLDDLDLDNLFSYDESDEFSGVSNESITALDRIVYENQSNSWAKAYTTIAQLAQIIESESHNHDDRYYTENETDALLADYLPLAGGTLTGDLTVSEETPTVVLDKTGGAGTNTMTLGLGSIQHDIWVGNNASLNFNAIPADGSSNSEMYMFYGSSTSGTRRLVMYDGAGSPAVQNEFNVGTGVANLCQQAGTIQQAGVNVALSTDLLDYVPRNERLQNGFPDASEVDMDWDDSTRTLTIQPVGASFRYYYEGVMFTETGSLTETLPDTEGLWVIYIDGEGSMAQLLNPSHEQVDDVIDNECIVAYVYWDATNNDGRLMPELHGSRMSPMTHHYLHDCFGAQYIDGMSLGDFVTDDSGDDDEDAQFSVAAGEFYDEDIPNELDAVGATTGLEIWYLDGTDWRWATNAGFSVLTTGSGRIAWNDGGTQAEADNGDFVLCHVFATNVTGDAGGSRKYIAIQGQAEYNTTGQARDGATVEISNLTYGKLPLEEVVPVASIIFQTNNGYANGVKGRVRTTDTGESYVDWRTSGLSPGISAADHGVLSGLSDDDHPQYLVASITDATAHLTMEVSNDTGSTLSAGDLCYISGDSSGVPQVILSDADAEATASKMLVLITEEILTGADGTALVRGLYTTSGLTASAIQYVSATAGDLTETAPSGTGDIVRIVGYAMSTTVLYFDPDNTWVEIA